MSAHEVLILFSQALSQPADSETQANILNSVKTAIEADSAYIPTLYPTIVSVTARAGNGTLLKRWIADTVELVVARMATISNALAIDQRIQLTIQSLDAILLLLEDTNLDIQKLGIQCFATAYPLIFRHACGFGSDLRLWEKAVRGKGLCLNAWRNGPTGAKTAGMKAVQKIVQSQTKGSMDPRLQNRGDINLSMCPSHHPFLKANELEAEANKLVEEAFTLLYTSRTPDVLASIIHTFAILVKARPALSHLIFGAFTNWTPNALTSSIPPSSATQIKSVEKAIRLSLIHLLRSGHGNSYAAQINDFLHRQDMRMKVAQEAEYKKKMDEAAGLKRQRGSEEIMMQQQQGQGQQPSSFNSFGSTPDHEEAALKRRRLDDGSISTSFATPPPGPQALNTNHGITRQHLMPLISSFKNSSGSSSSALSAGIAEFDISTLPVNLVLELVVANLQVLSEETLNTAIEKARQSLPPGMRTSSSETLRALRSKDSDDEDDEDEDVPNVKMEEEEVAAQDPLNLELDEDDLEGRALAAQALEKQNAADLAAAEAEAENALLASGTGAGAPSGRRRERSGTLDTSTTTSRQPSAEPASAAAASTSTSTSTSAVTNAPPQALASSTSKAASNANRAKSKLLHSAIGRICSVGISSAANIQAGGGDKNLWIQLISRLVTRGLPDSSNASGIENGSNGTEEDSEIIKKEKNAIRKQIFDFVTADLEGRMELARLWLNEEWYTQKKRGKRREDQDAAMDANGDSDADTQATQQAQEKQPYAIWLRQLLDFIADSSQEKGASFSHFFVDLPHIPKSELQRLVKMCTDPSGMKVGFMTLRDLATLRPPLRSDVMDVLLSLTTHTERPTRTAAILTIKRWIPDTQPLGQTGLAFALQLLKRLESPSPSSAAEATANKAENGDDMDIANGDDEVEAPKLPTANMAHVENEQVVDGLPYPTTEQQVAQHIELLLGLVNKSPDLLDELFKAYPRMSETVQQAIQSLFTPLIRMLGPSNPRILAVVQECPPGAEDLVLRILTILTEKGKLPAPLTSVIKSTAAEKDLSPRFMVPIIAEFDKVEITKHLPRIISLLNGKPAERDLVRSVFQSVVTTPPQNFGHSSTNVPRVRQSELLTPVELIILLHLSEKEIGIKQSIEAIGICFSMTEAFRPEVLAAFMQQIVDEATLPTLFLRTVIQAVTTYKSLQPYVSNTLLSRLITKKIWTMPQLWQGFIRCAKAIAPTSFGAILQLPREQIKELVTKQPDLRDGLKEYVTKKAGGNTGRISGLLEILDGA